MVMWKKCIPSHAITKNFNKEKAVPVKPLISTTIHFINLLGNHNLCQAFTCLNSHLVCRKLGLCSNLYFMVILSVNKPGLPVGTSALSCNMYVNLHSQFLKLPISQQYFTAKPQEAVPERVLLIPLEQEEEVPETKNPITVQHDPNGVETATCIKPKGKVVFDHVHFGYTPERTIINDFSTVVEPAIVKVALLWWTQACKRIS